MPNGPLQMADRIADDKKMEDMDGFFNAWNNLDTKKKSTGITEKK